MQFLYILYLYCICRNFCGIKFSLHSKLIGFSQLYFCGPPIPCFLTFMHFSAVYMAVKDITCYYKCKRPGLASF